MSRFAEWTGAGQPWRAAAPVRDLSSRLRGYGYTVYIRGNDAHLRHVPPEDHCPYSATGWPVTSPRWVVFALDIMAAPAGHGLPDLADLGAQIALDRNTGVPGAAPTKYMNWTPRGGSCRHEAWDPTHRTVGSDDVGHIHWSGRSDCADSTAMRDYDPVARLRGGGHPVTPGLPESATIPAWPGSYYRLTSPMTHAAGILTWQRQAHTRGNTISVDGWFGPQTNTVVRTVQTHARIAVDGVIGPDTWRAIFT